MFGRLLEMPGIFQNGVLFREDSNSADRPLYVKSGRTASIRLVCYQDETERNFRSLRQWWALLGLEVAFAFVRSEVAGDAAAREVEQQLGIHCVNLHGPILAGCG